tara:strand:- start:7652 stop:7813 length:162 start_codon:yes stop_codon:yes gene_type:complete
MLNLEFTELSEYDNAQEKLNDLCIPVKRENGEKWTLWERIEWAIKNKVTLINE